MKRIALILPYFGKFNNYFNIFLKSCEYNKDVDWFIFTDDKGHYNYPKNVKVHYMTFSELKNTIAQKFDFSIKLDHPYKLCDYKPAYGFIFEEYIKEYDFWGHCDCDVVFGDIKHFVDDDLMNNYDKLFCLGHFSLYRNTKEINRGFMGKLNGKERYREVFSSNEAFTFDEDYLPNNVNDVFEANGFRVFKEDMSANLSNRHKDFRLIRYDKFSCNYLIENKSRSVFVFEQGKIKRYQKFFNQMKKTEYMYMHFQNRPMKVEISEYNVFKIAVNRFIELEVDEVTNDNFDSVKQIYKTNFRREFVKREIKFWGKRIKQKLKGKL